ncbi:MAG TPA: Ada metal-binding domain-containing protein [Thermoanaerobaculia bacterium]|nr:Ada metal-binding domain-containing protein [Thermoanaerobaculia bacterium]
MYKESLAAISLCVIIAVGAVVMVEMHYHEEAPPPVFVAEVRAAEVRNAPVPVKTAYVGNTKTHKFHRASCRYASCKNCTAKYATREEALADGYRPCGTCDP